MPSGSTTGFREISVPAVGRLNLLLDLILRAGDIAIFVVAGMLAYIVRFGFTQMAPDYVHAISRGVLFALIILNGSSLYMRWRSRGVATEMLKLATL